MKTLNLYAEDFNDDSTWFQICDVLGINGDSGQCSVLFYRAQEKIIDQVKEIAVIWDIDDVKSLDLELDDEQCKEVLIRAKKYHDAGLGINWDVLEHHAHNVRNELIEKGAW